MSSEDCVMTNGQPEVIDILLVEDDSSHAELISRSFERFGEQYRIRTAGTISEALTMIGEHRPDIALVDYNLPDGKGQEVIEAGSEFFPSVILTSHGDEHLAVRAIKSGAIDYIAKSSESFEILPNSVERVLREWKLIEDRKRTEGLLRRSEERNRMILRTAMDGFWVVDMRSRILEVNESYCQMSGYTSDELLLMRVNDLDEGSTLPVVAERMEQIKKIGQDRFESKHRRKDGKIFDVEISVQYHPDDGGQFVVFLRDITERKRSEAKVRQLSLAIQQASTGVVITDVEGVIEYVNEAVCLTSGYSTEELIGKKKSIFRSEETPGNVYEEMWRSITAGNEWNSEMLSRRKDGSRYWESVVIAPVKNSKGNVINFIMVKVDITERKEMQTQLFRSQRMESIGTLAGGIAHDLNNILGPILLSVQILKRKLQDESLNNLLTTIESSTLRGKDIIAQVLGFARGAESRPVLMQIRHIVNEAGNIIKQTFPRNIEIQTYAPRDLWTVYADPTQIHQVVMNLSVNARDAMPKGGRLTINVKNAEMGERIKVRHPEANNGRYVVIEVRDNGGGIPLDIQQKIFDPFFTTKEVGKGTGLGLSSVYSIVKHHQGYIHFDSVPGEGTSFEILIPVSAETVAQDSKAVVNVILDGKNETILVVDDELPIQMACEQTLGFYNYNVLTAGNGAEGLARFVESGMTAKVVLIDMMMPVMDGKTAAATLRKIAPGISIIGMSGLMTESTVEHDGKLFDHFLQKPFTGESLMESIQNVLKKNQISEP